MVEDGNMLPVNVCPPRRQQSQEEAVIPQLGTPWISQVYESTQPFPFSRSRIRMDFWDCS